MKIKEMFRVIAAWKVEYITQSGELYTVEKPLSKGLVVLKITPGRVAELIEFMQRFSKKKDWRKLLLDVEISEHKEKRNLNQNALYWAVVAILTHVAYGCHGFEDEVHEGLLQVYAPRVEEKATKRLVPKRSKDMSKGEFAELIQGAFHEIAAQGVPFYSAPDIQKYWAEFYKWRWKDGSDLVVFKTLEDYREKVNYCEACMKSLKYNAESHAYEDDFIGHLAHIVSKGAGAGDTQGEVLHLCPTCHIQDQHAKGWLQFIQKYPHLEYKIEKARAAAGMKPLAEDLQEAEKPAEPELDIF